MTGNKANRKMLVSGEVSAEQIKKLQNEHRELEMKIFAAGTGAPQREKSAPTGMLE